MSFPIIDMLGGIDEALAILAKAGIKIKPHTVRVWQDRVMPPRAQLAFTNEANARGLDFNASDFKFQKEKANG